MISIDSSESHCRTLRDAAIFHMRKYVRAPNMFVWGAGAFNSGQGNEMVVLGDFIEQVTLCSVCECVFGMSAVTRCGISPRETTRFSVLVCCTVMHPSTNTSR